ncbi:2-polyprenyl-3-methyl-6-methoxy-1,4-benzoquinone monooxygenase [Lacisediminimonas sp.]|uniref:2-polyprenyl-3-methyl-6-methoxy-1,4-benzoquinone monooxygenase n=1 Tax=Lacisediminimonas sp. TaxID=3060582 RepID=UPI00271C3205|nr:2-polyprenyl-3-methyl-6-methoxy-1,4-benzoquinone monooxygenase [Lacisediminimonas sp.]MDO8301576.1 2-polyprenyl-3-methyl-6-methoxy-1,4-benzoquinone monooxygenase [Lacisediminimonas sp.]
MATIERLITGFDRALRVMAGVARASRPNPSAALAEQGLTDADRRHSAGLMRVNHVGEVCAQALYDAQGAFSRNDETRRQFERAGREEEDHLAWTAQRLAELNSRTSLLNPLWYGGAFLVGAAMAKMGDARSLGCVVETERQVEAHLDQHLRTLPAADAKSRAIVDQMRQDEIEHGAAAKALGAAELPLPIKTAMQGMAKVMTTLAYRI